MTAHPTTRIDPELLGSWPLPAADGDKSQKGTVLVVGGARQTPGAVLLAAEAALRVGAGKVQVATARDTAGAVAVALPEAYVEGLPVTPGGELSVTGAERVLELADGADVVLIGPGLGNPSTANLFVSQVVPGLDTSVVVDALGTAFLTDNLRGLSHLAGRAVLTPNTTELAVMLGRGEDEVEQDPLAACRDAADRTGASVLSGTGELHVAAPDGRAWCCDSGPSALATAGSGDVKAGVVTGLVARGASPEQAGAWGAWLHARAGALLEQRGGGYLARDVVLAAAEVLQRLTPSSR
ncbi:NAD(P)H-hydrate dehydratase [Terrabacter sp. NPDC000476]|uniref:NAD(P)H-hydrate dehydratase n=1 Tax=Terrabacter sp. NPDC000476 TaxID=3154258 RepID=UPI0033177419